MKSNLIKLKFIIDRLPLRDRAILAGGSILALSALWLFAFFYPQTHVITTTKQLIQSEKKQTKEFIQKRKTIERYATDDTVAKLMAKFERLKEKMHKLDERIARYEQRFIGEQELAKLLYSMLKKTQGVTIEDFYNVDYLGKQHPQQIDAKALIASAQSSAADNDEKKEAEPASASLIAPAPGTPEPVERTQYTLTLKGEYFSIMAYLQLLERLQWQLYWDKLEYKVEEYPIATATIQFYTLRPKDSGAISTSEGTAP